MGVKNRIIYPFEFINLPFKGNKNETYEFKKPFIKTVESVLTSDLQNSHSIGCKIENCHTHAGSKVHFDDFIEAELLFHNSYYNRGFSILVAQRIRSIQKDKPELKNIVLIGYENYCELFLQDLRWRLNDEESKTLCDWCIYETIKSKEKDKRKTESHIRNLNVTDEGEYEISYQGKQKHIVLINKTLFVFIVPINTTLSTMDKVVAKFRELRKSSDLGLDDLETINMDLICLITIGNKCEIENSFWDIKSSTDGSGNHLLSPKGSLTAIKGREILTFAYVESSWQSAKNCKNCFPSSNDLSNEEVLFGVNRGSVVPMLMISDNNFVEPFDSEKVKAEKNNVERIIELSEFLIYDHIIRNENHYQFYFNTVAYFESLVNDKKKKANLSLSIEKFKENLVNNHTLLYNLDRQFNDFKEELSKVSMTKDTSLKVFNCINEYKSELNKILTTEEVSPRVFDCIDKYKSKLTEILIKEEVSPKVFDEFVNKNINTIENSDIIYDYIVSPRHISNSGWVHYVKEKLFKNNEVRIFYFDVDKEYRSNIKAKYSDFTQSIKNIRKNKNKCTIRIHFVDDAINLGTSFLRTQNILSSLLDGDFVENVKVKLFYSIILLIGRISEDTQRFYLDSLWSEEVNYYESKAKADVLKRFYCFSKFSISPMRKFDDSCTLCRLASDFDKIRQFCSSNSLSNLCEDTIERHIARDSVEYVDEREKYDIIEKRYLFIITHILNQRMKNKLYYDKLKTDSTPLNRNSKDSKDAIKEIIKEYYRRLYDVLNNNSKKTDRLLYYKIAFIKAISRPFFIYHIRQRQAVFSFCMEKLSELIIKETKSLEEIIEKLCLVSALVKALTDLEANFLIRKEIIYHLNILAKQGDKIKNDDSLLKEKIDRKWIEKTIFTSDTLLLSLKKLLILSRETTKSIILEHVLIRNEEPVFSSENDSRENDVPCFVQDELLQKVYLENNRVLGSALQDIKNTLNVIRDSTSKNDADRPYFIDHLDEIWRANTTKSIYEYENALESYKVLRDSIKIDGEKYELSNLTKLDTYIKNLFKSILNIKDGESMLTSTSFICDNKATNNLFKYFMLELDAESWGEINQLQHSQKFYHEENIKFIHDNLDKNNDYILNVQKECLLIKFAGNSSNSNDESNIICFQINHFNSKSIKHWFAIKIFLTLRVDFANLIDKINIPVLVKSRSLDMQRRALSIDKALTHSPVAQTFGSYNNYKHPYFQIIANEFISSVYRNIVKGDEKTSNPVEFSVFHEYLNRMFDYDAQNDIYLAKIGRDQVEETIEIKITNHFANGFQSNVKVLQWGFEGCIESVFLLIVLMVMNASKYGESKSNMKNKAIEIIFEDEFLSFVNLTSEKTQKSEIENILNIPPWCYPQKNQSITLWTLYHSSVSDITQDGDRDKPISIRLNSEDNQKQKKFSWGITENHYIYFNFKILKFQEGDK